MMWSTAKPYPMDYPKLISGPFLSRNKFSELFQLLESSVRSEVLQNDILFQSIAHARDEERSTVPKSQVYPHGFYAIRDGITLPLEQGPSIEEWVNAFTHSQNPSDLLAELTESMSKFPLEGVFSFDREGDPFLLTHHGWVLEARCLPAMDIQTSGMRLMSIFRMLSQVNRVEINSAPRPLKRKKSSKDDFSKKSCQLP
jgi:hypothetical protein